MLESRQSKWHCITFFLVAKRLKEEKSGEARLTIT